MPIVTSKQNKNLTDIRQVAGDKQERDVAFYLKRAFKDRDDIYVFNDYAFSYKDENAQIDHLIVHKYGFMILESKSIYGEVKVNKTGEWSRSYKGQWSGIASPIKQAELQQILLKQMLMDNTDKFLGKKLGMQQGVRYRKWDSLCVVSNSCILHRDNIPADINDRIIKSEAVAETVEKVSGKGLLKAFLDTAPAFSNEELEHIVGYLLKQGAPIAEELSEGASVVEETNPTASTETIDQAPVVESTAPNHLTCKKCGETNQLQGCYGKYGYYVKCDACGTNTSMRVPCIRCGGTDVKITKKKLEYWMNCGCSEPYLLFRQEYDESS